PCDCRLDGGDFIFQAEDGIRDGHVTGVQTCALPIWRRERRSGSNMGPRNLSLQCKGKGTSGNPARPRVPKMEAQPPQRSTGTERSEERRVGKEWRYRWGRGCCRNLQLLSAWDLCR